MKYLITIKQHAYGNIEVEADSREEAKLLALKLAEANSQHIDWFEAQSYQIVEVCRLEEGNEK